MPCWSFSLSQKQKRGQFILAFSQSGLHYTGNIINISASEMKIVDMMSPALASMG